MDKVTDSYLNNEVNDEAVIAWIQGNISSQEDQNHIDLTTIGISSYAEHFTDKLHQSFDWLLKLAVNVPLTRTLFLSNKKSSSLTEDFQKTLNFTDHNSFPSLEEASKSQVKTNQILTKRIKPTLVSQSRTVPNENSSFQNVNYCKVNSASTSDSFKEERELLKNVREKKISEKSNLNSSAASLQSKAMEIKRLTVIKPKYEAVTYKEEIIKLKTLYIQLLMNNHSASLIEEIKFITAIINKRATSECALNLVESADKMERIFSSYHNCFYFAYLAFTDLFIQNLLINLLSFKTVEQIKSNDLLINYRTDDGDQNLKELIEESYLGHADEQQSNCTAEDDFVYFQPDTDDKSNFPNDHSFYVFRKQRDDFYKLLKKYTESNWSASIAGDLKQQSIFTAFINGILSMSKDVGNYYHLARLFISQLLKSCNRQSGGDKSGNLNNKGSQSNRNSLSYNEEKYKKLQDRFERKPRNNENNLSFNLLEESFSESERFFSDFIYYGDSHSFNEQLKLQLKSQLLAMTSLELNSFVEKLVEQEGESGSLLLFLGRIHLHAKFFGFLVFYPLNTSLSENTPKRTSEILGNSRKEDSSSSIHDSSFARQQKSLRSTPEKEEEPPVLDIESYLLRMMERHYLVVAVPWVVEFLFFADPITLSMAYYDSVLGLLCLIYKYYLPRLSSLTAQRHSHNDQTVSYTRLFIQLSLERLFSAKKFNAPGRLAMLAANTTNPEEVCAHMFHSVVEENDDETQKVHKGSGSLIYLDFHNDIFDFEQMATFFPHFSRLVETQFRQQHQQPPFASAGRGNEVVVRGQYYRKITPTTISKKVAVTCRLSNAFATASMNGSDDSLGNANSQIQQQAEECFLNICSKSLRNSIKFISERITSTCIKAVKRDAYPRAKEAHFGTFLRENAPHFAAHHLPGGGISAEVLNGGTAVVNLDLTGQLAEAIRGECRAFVCEYSDAKTKVLFPHVIDDELEESVSAFSVRICLRTIRQNCNNWIELNISTETVNTDLLVYLKQQQASVLGPKSQSSLPVASLPATSAFSSPEEVAAIFKAFERLLYDLREVLCTVNNTSGPTASAEGSVDKKKDSQLCQGSILELLRRIKSVRVCTLLAPSNAPLFDQVTLDLALSLVAFRPHLLTDDLLDAFLALWRGEGVTYPRVLCLKTLHMVTRSTSQCITTWLKFEFLLTRMLVAGVVSFADLAATAESVLRENWPPNVLSKYASLLQAVVSTAKEHDLFLYDDASHQILDWLSWFCAQNPDLPE